MQASPWRPVPRRGRHGGGRFHSPSRRSPALDPYWARTWATRA